MKPVPRSTALRPRSQKKRKRSRATLKDIARTLSVSTATVSKALSDKSDISPELKRIVRKTAEKMGYRPNLFARSLITNSNKILGIVVPDFRISYFPEVMNGMSEVAESRGYECVFTVHDESEQQEKEKLEFLYDMHVAGILINPTCGKSTSALLKNISREGKRIVCWDRELPGSNFRSVKIDDVEASYKLTCKLIDEGRTRILLLAPKIGSSQLSDRISGYRMALKEKGIRYRQELVAGISRDIEDSEKVISHLLERGRPFDAVMGTGGFAAYGAGLALLKMRRRIPEDVVLAEFGNNDIMWKLGVPFYSVLQNPRQIGESSARLLIEMLESPGAHVKYEDIKVDFDIVESEPIHRAENTSLHQRLL